MSQNSSQSKSPRKKIAVLYPVLMGGGAEAVCAWILQALQDEFDVALYTLVHLSVEELNRYFGTRLTEDKIRIKSFFPRGLAWFLRRFFAVYPLREQRQDLLEKFFRKRAGKYDLAISAYNELDMGIRGIQYVHNVGVVGKRKRGRAYEKNLTLVNSRHTADRVKDLAGVEAEVLYPPVFSAYSGLSWEKREDAFVCLGRLVSAKMAHRAISILKKVRARGHDVVLRIIGGSGEPSYMRFLEKMREKNKEWVFIYKDLPREGLNRVLETSRFGLHIKPEPFGIVPAEMICAGMIPFVRKSQGLVEVVGEKEEILFSKDHEAAEKIVGILSSEKSIRDLRNYINERKKIFSEKSFCRQMLEKVKSFLREE